ncbi:hypothetical protein GCM10008967_02520 [Bacillus carboniphilus]|uniref:Uncharacterized protein n=1 Tax=Bacillus carboniphilus TaxID=86663 RepID=A0ABN0VRJ4_9BACI
MGFATFFFISWIVIAVFAVMPKQLKMTETSFVYLVILIVSINMSWIVAEELKFIKITDKGIDYTAYLLNRSIINPVVLILFLNVIIKQRKLVKKLLYIGSSSIILTIISYLSTFFQITEFIKWNVVYEFFYYFILSLLALFARSLYEKVSMKEVIRST